MSDKKWFVIRVKLRLISWFKLLDDNGDETSERVLEHLEKIDDDCDKYGIQFVKIDDNKANKEYGIDKVRDTK